uniref:Uncharacterized protein n=1 Tax=Nymphaea colorata TaxID=210225 RepID=A0A5K0V0K6_9MAGN
MEGGKKRKEKDQEEEKKLRCKDEVCVTTQNPDYVDFGRMEIPSNNTRKKMVQ